MITRTFQVHSYTTTLDAQKWALSCAPPLFHRLLPAAASRVWNPRTCAVSSQQISPVWHFTLAVAVHLQNCMSAKVFCLRTHEPPSSISSLPLPPRHAVGSAVNLRVQTSQSAFSLFLCLWYNDILGQSFQFNLSSTVWYIKKKKKRVVLQAFMYGKNSSSKNKPFLLKLEPEA